jgi:hypothetical protein
MLRKLWLERKVGLFLSTPQIRATLFFWKNGEFMSSFLYVSLNLVSCMAKQDDAMASMAGNWHFELHWESCQIYIDQSDQHC